MWDRGVWVGAGCGNPAPGSRWGPEGGSHAGRLGCGQSGYSAGVVQGLGVLGRVRESCQSPGFGS